MKSSFKLMILFVLVLSNTYATEIKVSIHNAKDAQTITVDVKKKCRIYKKNKSKILPIEKCEILKEMIKKIDEFKNIGVVSSHKSQLFVVDVGKRRYFTPYYPNAGIEIGGDKKKEETQIPPIPRILNEVIANAQNL